MTKKMKKRKVRNSKEQKTMEPKKEKHCNKKEKWNILKEINKLRRKHEGGKWWKKIVRLSECQFLK